MTSTAEMADLRKDQIEISDGSDTKSVQDLTVFVSTVVIKFQWLLCHHSHFETYCDLASD